MKRKKKFWNWNKKIKYWLPN